MLCSEVFGLRCEDFGLRCEAFGLRCEGLGLRCEDVGLRCEGLGLRCEAFGLYSKHSRVRAIVCNETCNPYGVRNDGLLHYKLFPERVSLEL
ncbi:MAG: hypothetical protein LBH30_05555 [Prevotellaceae bacterium]|nr:hypothetical protein [Prevotellaceae bacterium]